MAPNQTAMMSTLVGVGSVLIWSSAVAVSGRLAAAFGPLTAAGLEFGIAGALLFFCARVSGDFRGMLRHSRSYYFICGGFWLLNVTFFWLAVGAVQRPVELVVVGLCNYLWPALTLIGAIVVLKKKWELSLWWGVGLALLGVLLGKVSVDQHELHQIISTITDSPNIGAYSFALVAAISWALYSNFTKLYAHPDGKSAVPLFMSVAACLLLLAGQVRSEASTANILDYCILIVYGFCSGFAFWAWDNGMRFGNIVLISALAMLIPLFSTVITALSTGFAISHSIIISALLVVTGSWVCQKSVEH